MNGLVKKFFPHDHRTTSLVVLSLLGAWIVTVPYEGQILYTLAESFNIDSYELLKISLVMQAVGLIAGGLLLKTMKASKWLLMIAIPFCMACTVLFCFESYWIWIISLLSCSALAGACIAACGHFFKLCTVPGQRFNAAIVLIITISILKLLINITTMYLSLYAGIALSAAILGVAFYFATRLPHTHTTTILRVHNRRKVAQALVLLCLFISVATIDFGIMIQTITPQYKHIEWLSSWYWLLPYIAAALIMKRTQNSVDRSNTLYTSIGMIGIAFILSIIVEKTVMGYLIIFTLMMGSWAVYDVFWWSMLGEMLDMQKNAALILGLGFGANVLGVLNGKMIATSQATLTGVGTFLTPLAIICITLVILPILHRSLSGLLANNISDIIAADEAAKPVVSMVVPSDIDALTERERQIVALMLKGQTCKLIAAGLYLSENTVKTHIKNIYAKLGIRRKSELFSRMMK